MRVAAVLAVSIALVGASARAEGKAQEPLRFGEVMNSVFGAGHWRQTGGYRTPERENELRAQGALTVPVGVLSRHSMGRPGAPGAYDLVVEGMSPWQAAEKLRQAGAPFARLFAEGAHGTQGAHLHVEPSMHGLQPGGGRTPGLEWTVADPTPAQLALARLHDLSAQGQADAQLRLGEIYAEGREAPKDLIAAFVWTSIAASNSAAGPALRQQAERGLGVLARIMKADEMAHARRLVSATGDGDRAGQARCAAAQEGESAVVMISTASLQPPACAPRTEG